LAAVAQAVPTLAAFAGSLGNGPDILADFLSSSENLIRRCGTLHFYATMSQAVDTGDSQAQSMVGQAAALFGRLSAAVSFRDPELIALGQAVLDAWIAQNPRLQPYAHFSDNLFRQQRH